VTASTLRCRTLIFDMDGLMVDSEPLWWRVEKALAREHDQSWSDELATHCVGKGLPYLIETMRRELGLPLSVNEGVAWLVEQFVARVDELQLKTGCVELIEAARTAQRTLAVASSSPQRLIDAVLARFQLAPPFDAIVSGEQVTHPKPAPDIFLRTAELLSTAPADCVVLEDSLAGVRAGRAAGMSVIAVPEHDPERFTELTPHVVHDLHQARRLLGW
jgi:HAD superfamily hydrolase (TIGR01509 family)